MSPREEQVMELLVYGVTTDKAIARELGIAPSTVGRHIWNMMLKIGVRRRVLLVRAWIDKGEVSRK